MTATGLQKYIDINLDGSKDFKVDISIYSPDPSQGVITTAEVLGANVESVLQVAEETLQGSHSDSIITFKFPRTLDTLECFREGGEIVCRKSPIYRL
jgi:hypothetical protein